MSGETGMKWYITGPVGSGKSTLARRMSQILQIPCHHLDEVMYERDPTDSWGDKKRPVEERDALFSKILEEPDSIMEDAGRLCFFEGMRRADAIVLLEPPPRVRRWRIVRRLIRQKLHWEPCHYTPSLTVLRAMLRWTREYKRSGPELHARVENCPGRVVCIRTSRELRAFLENLPVNLPPVSGG